MYPYWTAERVVVVNYVPKRQGDGRVALFLYWDQMQKFRDYVYHRWNVPVHIVYCEGLHVQQIAFPHVHHVNHSLGVAGEMLPHRLVKRVCILLF